MFVSESSKPITKTKKKTLKQRTIKNTPKSILIDANNALIDIKAAPFRERICKKFQISPETLVNFAMKLRLHCRNYSLPVMSQLWAGAKMEIDKTKINSIEEFNQFADEMPQLGLAYQTWMKVYLKRLSVPRSYRSKVSDANVALVGSAQHLLGCMKDTRLLSCNDSLLSWDLLDQ